MESKKPIIMHIHGPKDKVRPFMHHLETILDALDVAIMNENIEKLDEIRFLFHEFLATLENKRFSLTHPTLAKTNRETNTTKPEDVQEFKKKIWTIINGERVEYDSIEDVKE